MFTAVKQSKRTDLILTKTVIDKYKLERKRAMIHAWRDSIRLDKNKKKRIIMMMRNYKRQQMNHYFRKLKKITFTTKKPLKILGIPIDQDLSSFEPGA
jgi:hypothetical protein